VAVGLLVFGGYLAAPRALPALLYAVLPLLYWAAIRFGPGGLSWSLLGLTLLASWTAAKGLGPFGTLSAANDVLAMQLFLLVISVPLFVLAGLLQDRAQAEATLQESEARLRAVVETQTELITRYQPDTTLTFVNDATCRFEGKSREELLGTSILATMPEDAAAQVRAMVETLVAAPEPGIVTIEHEATSHDGSPRWQQWVNRTIRDEAGQVLELQGIGRDITDRKQMEEALRASEARYRAVVRHLPQTAVLLFDGERRHTFAEGPGLQALGLTPEELEGRMVGEAFPRELAAALAPHYDAALVGEAVEVEVEREQHIYRIQVVPLPADRGADPAGSGAHGGHAGMVVVQDVTARRRARDELERERTRSAVLAARSQEFQTLAEHSPDFIARFDPAGRLQYVNQAAAEQLGRPAKHWVGKTFAELGLPQDVATRWDEGLRGVLATRLPGTFDAEVRAPVGQVRSLHTRYVPEVAEDGTLQSVLGIATDVSALKQAEARLAEQAGQLEAIFEAQADGVLVFDQDGHALRANPAWRDWFRTYVGLSGLSADPTFAALPFAEQVDRWTQFERSHQYMLQDVHGRAIPVEELPFSRALRGETVTGAHAIDERVEGPDGCCYEVSVSAAPVRDAAGRIVGGVAVARDVTARRALERQVREQAAQLEAVFAAMTDGVLVVNAEGHITRINPAGQALVQLMMGDTWAPEAIQWTPTERTRELHLRDSADRAIPVEQWPTVRLLQGEVLAGATALTLRFGSDTDQPRSLSFTGGPLRDATGQIMGAVGVVRDVTELEQAQAALAEQELKYRTLVENSPDIIARFDREGRYQFVSAQVEAATGLPAQELLGKTDAELGLPAILGIPAEQYANLSQVVAQAAATGEKGELELEFTGHTGTHTYLIRVIAEQTEDGSVASVVTVTTDITKLKQTEQALREATAAAETARQAEERRKQIAESLRGVLAVLNSTRPPNEVLQYIARQAEDLLGSDAAVIYGPDPLTDSTSPGSLATTLRVQAAHGLRIESRRPQPHQRLLFADAVVAQALATAQPVALVAQGGRRPSAGHPPVGADGTLAIPHLHGALPAPYYALLAIPIRIQDGPYGCLLLFYAQPSRMAAEEVDLAQVYADQVAQAITNARLQAHIAQEATVVERNRLARELHDTVTQEIFSASLLAESLPRNWQTQRAVAEASLQQLHGLTRGALAGLRVLLLELRPSELEHMPLAQLLRQLGAALSSRAGGGIAVKLDDCREDVVDALPIEVKVALYRIAQEALTNAAKHAAARSITVHLRTTRTGGLVLEITDDGRGFDSEAIPAGHFGLAIMHERAQAMGATVRVQSHPGQGTRVVVAWRPGRTSRTHGPSGTRGTRSPAPREEAGDERVRARAGTPTSADSHRDR
jgi:PAS domain S-box-containing protein